MREALIWGALVLVLAAPVIAAAFSPLLAWRQPVYIASGFAGIIALALIVLQPLLAAGLLPGVSDLRGRRLHKYFGLCLIGAIILHVGGLWITSPPDVVDALLFVSPTPFSIWGVIAMWALFAAAFLALQGRRFGLRWSQWRASHVTLVTLAVSGTVVHALLIEGTMETATKIILCSVAALALAKALLALRSTRRRAKRNI